MADKLGVWNQALIHLEAAPIATLTDQVTAVNVFGNAWTGVVEEAFNEGDWNFAKKSATLVESGTGSASVGYSYVYDYPDDYLRTVTVSLTTSFNDPYTGYIDEGGYLHTNFGPVYLRYIRNDLVDDADVGEWPTMFWRYVAAKLAYETCGRLTQGTSLKAELSKVADKALRKAKSVDARQERNKPRNEGSWMRARHGGARHGDDTSISVIGAIPLLDGDI